MCKEKRTCHCDYFSSISRKIVADKCFHSGGTGSTVTSDFSLSIPVASMPAVVSSSMGRTAECYVCISAIDPLPVCSRYHLATGLKGRINSCAAARRINFHITEVPE